MINLDASKLIALKLSSLNQSDFDWIYERLDNNIKGLLDPLIQEIREIGFDIHPNEVDAMMKKNHTSKWAEETKHEASVTQLIDKATSQDVISLFKAESVYFLGTLIQLNNWSWQKDKDFALLSKHDNLKVITDYKSKPLLIKAILSATTKALHKQNDKAMVGATHIDSHLLTSPLLSTLKAILKWK